MLNLIPTAAFNLRFVFQQLASLLAASSLVFIKVFLFVSHDILSLQKKKLILLSPNPTLHPY